MRHDGNLDLRHCAGDFFAVKFKTPLTLALFSLVALTFSPSRSYAWFGHDKERTHSSPVAMGDNTFSITRQAHNGFDHDMERLRAEAQEDAQLYCAAHGKQLKIVTFSEDKPYYTLGYATAKIVFKALDANDPELTAAPAPAGGTMPASTASYTQSGGQNTQTYTPTYTTNGGFDLYTELNKLDDLRKRGLLTDKEFEKEKKKLLKRSK